LKKWKKTFKDVVEQLKSTGISENHLVQSYSEAGPTVVLEVFLIVVFIISCLNLPHKRKQWF